MKEHKLEWDTTEKLYIIQHKDELPNLFDLIVKRNEFEEKGGIRE